MIALSAATIVVALFAQSGRTDVYPGHERKPEVIDTAFWVLRRKEAWARLASYLAFILAVWVAIAAAKS